MGLYINAHIRRGAQMRTVRQTDTFGETYWQLHIDEEDGSNITVYCTLKQLHQLRGVVSKAIARGIVKKEAKDAKHK